MSDDQVVAQESEADRKRRLNTEYNRIWRARNRESCRRSYRKYVDTHADKLASVEYKRKESERKIESKKRLLKTTEGKANKRKQERQRYGKTSYALNHNKRWSKDEIRAIFNHGMTDAEIAKLLLRSVASIQIARNRYRNCAPIGWQAKGTKPSQTAIETE